MVTMTVCSHPALRHVNIERSSFDAHRKIFINSTVTSGTCIEHSLLTLFPKVFWQDIDRCISTAELGWLRTLVDLNPLDCGNGDTIAQNLSKQCAKAGSAVE